MAAHVVNLDLHRNRAERLVVMFRRELIRSWRNAELGFPADPSDRVLHAQLTAPPAETWDEVACRADFLLARMNCRADRTHPDIQTLTRRVLQDVVRLLMTDETPHRD